MDGNLVEIPRRRFTPLSSPDPGPGHSCVHWDLGIPGHCGLEGDHTRDLVEVLVLDLVPRLSITVKGNGTVASGDLAINCSIACGADYPIGTEVTLTATHGSGSIFSGWSGGGCSGTGACIVTMNADTEVTATFNASTSITLTSPNGGENWRIGTTQTIRWTSTGITGKVKIHLSRDGGGTWATTVTKGTANDGSHPWKVTKPATTRAKIRVCSVSLPSKCDPSDANFTIR